VSTRLLLVRHGEIDWTGRIGAPNDGLNAMGRRQAEAIGARLASMGAMALYSSTLPRAMQTSEIVSSHTGLEVRAEKDLREWDPGEWLGLREEDAEARYPELWARREEWDFAYPGAESVADLRDRSTSVAQRIAENHPGDEVILVTHGGWISNFVWHILGVDSAVLVERGYHRGGNQPFVFDNCSFTVVEFDGVRPILRSLNDTSHLDGLTS
jgi:broad specificity phosphatase PhoE